MEVNTKLYPLSYKIIIPKTGDPVIIDGWGKCELGGIKGQPGGESTVYQIKGKKGYLAKILNRESLTKYKKEKILKMIKETTFGQCQYASFPIKFITTINKDFVGFCMICAQGQSLLDYKPSNYQGLIDLCYEIILTITRIYNLSNGIIIGDIQKANMIRMNNGTIIMIDCDSFQYMQYLCTVGRPEYTANEIADTNSCFRTKESEAYAVAVLLFQLLMNNKNPYDRKGGGSLQENIKKSIFPYNEDGSVERDSVPPKTFLQWIYLPQAIRKAFCNTFKSTAPEQRTQVSDWLSILKEYKDTFKNQISYDPNANALIKEKVPIGIDSIKCTFCGAETPSIDIDKYGLCPDHTRELLARHGIQVFISPCEKCGSPIYYTSIQKNKPRFCLSCKILTCYVCKKTKNLSDNEVLENSQSHYICDDCMNKRNQLSELMKALFTKYIPKNLDFDTKKRYKAFLSDYNQIKFVLSQYPEEIIKQDLIHLEDLLFFTQAEQKHLIPLINEIKQYSHKLIKKPLQVGDLEPRVNQISDFINNTEVSNNAGRSIPVRELGLASLVNKALIIILIVNKLVLQRNHINELPALSIIDKKNTIERIDILKSILAIVQQGQTSCNDCGLFDSSLFLDFETYFTMLLKTSEKILSIQSNALFPIITQQKAFNILQGESVKQYLVQIEEVFQQTEPGPTSQLIGRCKTIIEVYDQYCNKKSELSLVYNNGQILTSIQLSKNIDSLPASIITLPTGFESDLKSLFDKVVSLRDEKVNQEIKELTKQVNGLVTKYTPKNLDFDEQKRYQSFLTDCHSISSVLACFPEALSRNVLEALQTQSILFVLEYQQLIPWLDKMRILSNYYTNCSINIINEESWVIEKIHMLDQQECIGEYGRPIFLQDLSLYQVYTHEFDKFLIRCKLYSFKHIIDTIPLVAIDDDESVSYWYKTISSIVNELKNGTIPTKHCSPSFVIDPEYESISSSVEFRFEIISKIKKIHDSTSITQILNGEFDISNGIGEIENLRNSLIEVIPYTSEYFTSRLCLACDIIIQNNALYLTKISMIDNAKKNIQSLTTSEVAKHINEIPCDAAILPPGCKSDLLFRYSSLYQFKNRRIDQDQTSNPHSLRNLIVFFKLCKKTALILLAIIIAWVFPIPQTFIIPQNSNDLKTLVSVENGQFLCSDKIAILKKNQEVTISLEGNPSYGFVKDSSFNNQEISFTDDYRKYKLKFNQNKESLILPVVKMLDIPVDENITIIDMLGKSYSSGQKARIQPDEIINIRIADNETQDFNNGIVSFLQFSNHKTQYYTAKLLTDNELVNDSLCRVFSLTVPKEFGEGTIVRINDGIGFSSDNNHNDNVYYAGENTVLNEGTEITIQLDPDSSYMFNSEINTLSKSRTVKLTKETASEVFTSIVETMQLTIPENTLLTNENGVCFSPLQTVVLKIGEKVKIEYEGEPSFRFSKLVSNNYLDLTMADDYRSYDITVNDNNLILLPIVEMIEVQIPDNLRIIDATDHCYSSGQSALLQIGEEIRIEIADVKQQELINGIITHLEFSKHESTSYMVTIPQSQLTLFDDINRVYSFILPTAFDSSLEASLLNEKKRAEENASPTLYQAGSMVKAEEGSIIELKLNNDSVYYFNNADGSLSKEKNVLITKEAMSSLFSDIMATIKVTIPDNLCIINGIGTYYGPNEIVPLLIGDKIQVCILDSKHKKYKNEVQSDYLFNDKSNSYFIDVDSKTNIIKPMTQFFSFSIPFLPSGDILSISLDNGQKYQSGDFVMIESSTRIFESIKSKSYSFQTSSGLVSQLGTQDEIINEKSAALLFTNIVPVLSVSSPKLKKDLSYTVELENGFTLNSSSVDNYLIQNPSTITVRLLSSAYRFRKKFVQGQLNSNRTEYSVTVTDKNYQNIFPTNEDIVWSPIGWW